MGRISFLVLAAGMAWCTACGGEGSTAGDAGPDPGTDARVDVPTSDPGVDPGTDPGVDPGREDPGDRDPGGGDAPDEGGPPRDGEGGDAAEDARPGDAATGGDGSGTDEEATEPDAATCDGAPPVDWFLDCDGDGLAAEGAEAVAGCEAPALPGVCPNEAWVAVRPDPETPESIDCADQDAAVNPMADEVCDYVDNDCDGRVDTDSIDAIAWFPDCDHDGIAPFEMGTAISVCFGEPSRPPDACQEGAWTDRRPRLALPKILDCDDNDPAVHSLMQELCDEKDNDCDGDVDETTPALYWYEDCDRDGFAPPEADTDVSCAYPAAGPFNCPTTGTWTLQEPIEGKADCNDQVSLVHPEQVRFFTTPIAGESDTEAWDYDCSGTITFAFTGDCTNGEDYTCVFSASSPFGDGTACFTEAKGLRLEDDHDACYKSLPKHQVCGRELRRPPNCTKIGIACSASPLGGPTVFTAACH